jgi:hypothetical protein
MRWVRGMVNTSWDWKLVLLKDLHSFQYHLRVYINKKRENVEKSSTPHGIT